MTSTLREYVKAHRWLAASTALAATAVAVAVLIHTPPVRAWVLSSLLSRLPAAGLEARIDALDYNLFLLRVGVRGVELSAAGSDVPFFSADAISLDLPWSAVTGTLAVQALDVDRPRIAIVRAPDGSLNLPETAADDPDADAEPIGAVRIDRLAIRGLDARYADTPASLSVDGRGVTLDLDRGQGDLLAGRLSMSDGVTLRVGDRDTRVETLEGDLAFDGAALTIEALALDAPEARLQLDGVVTLLAGEQRLELRYDARLDAERLAPWADLDPAPRGHVTLAGTVRGPLAAPDLTVAVASDGLAWSSLGALSLDARAALSGTLVTLESFRATVAGGEIAGDAVVHLENDGSSHLRARVANLNLGALATVAPDLPVQLASVADGELTFDWSGSDVSSAEGAAGLRLRATPARAGRLALAGQVDLELADGAWALSLDQRIADAVVLRGQAGGRLARDDFAASTLDGRTTVRIASVPDALRRLSAAGLGIDAQLADRLRGAASADLALAGTLGAPRAQGTLDATDVWLDETGPLVAHAGLAATRAGVDVDPLRLDLGPNTVRGRLTVGIDANTIQGTIAASLPELALVARAVPPGWRPDGSTSLDVRLGGALDNPTVGVTLASDDLRVAGQSLRNVRSSLELADQIVTVDALELTQDVGRLAATGRYDLRSGAYAFDAFGDDLVITPLLLEQVAPRNGSAEGAAPLPLDARFNLRARGEGTTAAPEAEALLEFAHLDWDRYRLGAARLEAAVAKGRARVEARVPSINATVEAGVELEGSQPFTFTLAVVDATLEELVRPSGPAGTRAAGEQPAIDPADLAGAVSLRATGHGRLDDVAGATVDLDLRLVDVGINGAPLRLERPARLRYTGAEIVADDVELRIGGSTLTARGALGTTRAAGEALVVELVGSLADLVPFARLAPGAETFNADGAIDLRVRAAGSLEAPDLSAELSLERASVASGTLPPVAGVSLRAGVADGLLQLTDVRATWQGASVSAAGQVPVALFGDAVPESYRHALADHERVARASVQVASITPQVLAPFMDQQTVDQIAGRFDATVALEADTLDAAGVRADLTFTRAEVELARVPLGQVRPTRLRLADGRLDVVEWTWAGAGNRLDVFGEVVLADAAPRLDLAVVAGIDLRMIGAFAPDLATAGRANLDVRAIGPADDPIVEGQVTIADADLIVREPRFAITDLEGLLTLTRDRVQLRRLSANANGGALSASGEVAYPDFQLAGGTLAITGRGLAFEIPEDLRTEVDADLEFALSPDAPALTGRVTILRGSYREPISLTGQLLASRVEVVAAAPEEAEPGFADRIALNLSVVSAEDLVIDNNYGRLELASNLKVIGTLGQPVLAGRLTVQEGGEVFLGGQRYQVRRGTVDFTSATRIEPNVDLALETRVQRYDITLEVSGTPEMLEASLRSPGLSQEDVVSLLLTGRLADEATMAQTEIARGQLLMLLSGELLGFAGRAVGLDSVQLSRGLGGAASDFDLLATNTNPSARLTLTKDLSRDVQLVFSQSLRESGDITWIAIYRPLRSLEFRGTTEDDGARAYEFRHDLDFGGGVAPAGPRAARAPAESARVAEVRITGSPGFDEAALRARIELDEGDRFDFYRWQQDQDRLAAFYAERDHLEARIAARRRGDVSGNGAITLEYAIDRGPRTELTVEGFTPPNGLVARMKTAWSRAVFDGFLLEDLQAMARQALVEQAYLQAQVSAEVTSPPESETKTIVVRIAPGTRFTSRRIVFAGTERVASPALDALVRARGLEATAWLSPGDLEASLEQYYASLGYLAADATVEAPVYDGPSATVPVRIAEGRQFVVASVEVQGTSAKPEAEVREAFGIATDAPYVPATIEPARREVEVGYLRDGFNDVRVAVTTLVDRERARVDLALSVDEGRQQILARVDVSGAEVTSRGTIERALALEPGNPANLSDYYRAQKRLYDTGVFQSADVVVEPVEGGGDGQTQPVRASVQLQELPPYRFRYGFRLNDAIGPAEAAREVRPAFVADLLRRNLFGRAVSTGLAGQIEADRRLGRGFLSLPQLFGLPVTTNLFLTASRENFSPEGAAFIDDRSDITAEQRFRPAWNQAVSYGYSFTRSHVFDLDPTPGLPVFDIVTKIARLTSTYAWDTRDDPANARRGWFHSSGLEYGSAALGSDLRFIRYLAQQYYFTPVGDQIVLASAFRLGAARGFGQELIPSERFFAGGATSVRGFAEDGLGAIDFFGSPTGGSGLLLLNQEVRFPIYRWIHGVGFADAGNVFGRAGDLSLTNLEAGAGLGLRIDSPFALIRVDFGVPVTSRTGQPAGRWYFAIGQTF